MIRLLDTPRSRPYKTRPLWLLAGLLLALPAFAVEVEGGARLPDGAQKVAERRYRTRQNFDETLKHFRSAYPPAAYPRRQIVNQPGIKAIHIVNPSKKGFEGLNIYQANDEVRIYVVPAQAKPEAEKKGNSSKPK